MPTAELSVYGPVALVALRLFAVLRMQPLWGAALGAAWTPAAAGLSVVLAASVAVTPGAVAAVPEGGGAATWIALGVFEVLLGTVLGALASLPGHALLGAAGASARVLRTAPRPFVALCVGVGLVAALGLGVHRAALVVLTDSFAVLPAGAPTDWVGFGSSDLLVALLATLDGLVVLGLALATPALLAAAVGRLAVGLVATGPASVRGTVSGFDAWVGVALALFALGASWAVYPRAWARGAEVPEVLRSRTL